MVRHSSQAELMRLDAPFVCARRQDDHGQKRVHKPAHHDLLVPAVKERQAGHQVLLFADALVFAAHPRSVVVDEGDVLAIVGEEDVVDVEVVYVVADAASASRPHALVQQLEEPEVGAEGGVEVGEIPRHLPRLAPQCVAQAPTRRLRQHDKGQQGTGGQRQHALVQALREVRRVVLPQPLRGCALADLCPHQQVRGRVRHPVVLF
mmetsp:Transcript_95511/g.279298  ORF Transcript_95511/g.279298 Transcript_95511/m.279298 type:complete len:206 (+) Transcript_95511:314-931(+)